MKIGDKAVVTGPLRFTHDEEDRDYGHVFLTRGELVEVVEQGLEIGDVLVRSLKDGNEQYIAAGSLSPAKEPRVWEKFEDVPGGIAVTDRDGTRWVGGELDRYAPFTEVIA
ncbi:hypothetical protein SEA_JACKSPARROW_56 [Mycobacterium phage JackSparrow]|uniref:hypothetical protein n=1 Tax=Mycobacterium phage Abrogate TaxID=1551710 RepID=UPI00051A9AAE|nr:hypothetical protein AVT14_gp53 [Mycobacterium phage Abrogate]AIT13197.1 hypothetical protein PBI_ABROGATE_530 [Mycobacterium phage Abrogate]QFP96749.1 hypothetical protein SEA_JACKSPARROW_56 [Mycobacterium phage JackSparrow]